MFVSCRTREMEVLLFMFKVDNRFLSNANRFLFLRGVWGINALKGYRTHLLALYRRPLNNAEQVQLIEEIYIFGVILR